MENPREQKVLALELWGEIVGRLIAVRREENWLRVELDCGVLLFPIDGPGAITLEEDLRDLIGKVIGIIRTDLGERTILVRVLKDPEPEEIKCCDGEPAGTRTSSGESRDSVKGRRKRAHRKLSGGDF